MAQATQGKKVNNLLSVNSFAIKVSYASRHQSGIKVFWYLS